MDIHKRILIFAVAFLFLFFSCKNKTTTPTGNATVIADDVELNIADILQIILNNNGKFKDTSTLFYPLAVKKIYTDASNNAVWTKSTGFSKIGTELYTFIEHSMDYGLFPNDYHFVHLQQLKKRLTDSAQLNKKSILSQADILLTDGFLQLATHLKKGRLAKDSVTLTSDTTLQDTYFVNVLQNALKTEKITSSLQQLEPLHKDYVALKNALPDFVRQMNLSKYTTVIYPQKDSTQLVKNVMHRLYEEGLVATYIAKPDSGTYTNAVTKYQKSKGIKVTGKVNDETVKNFNANDWYKFKRIAATLDKYKTLPAQLPSLYVWVNLPSYKLKVVHNDSIAMESKVIIGKPANRTPELNSEISNIVLYPTWTVPYSIVLKEMLPIAKRNPGYFARRGFKVINGRGKEVNAASINWSKYGKNVPFTFRQNEGGGNALGVIKFNFENPYAVYLHDTNQRYLFERTSRALSHGCVRVHLWDSMARYLIAQAGAYYPNYEVVKRDSIAATGDTITLANSVLKDSTYIIADSLHRYMAKKKNMALLMQQKVPIYLRYFSCEAIANKIIFYDDVYKEDKTIIDKYFANK